MAEVFISAFHRGLMRRNRVYLNVILLVACNLPGLAQESQMAVPPMINFSGTFTDLNGKPVTGIVGVTFYLYKDHQGGAPLWMETQNVQADRTGHYSVVLGSATRQGLPADLFASGEARWLAVQAQGQAEQPRIMLVAVPYAMKAADAQTLGGFPPSAFLLAAPPNANIASAANLNGAASVISATTSDVTTSGGQADTIPMFTAAANVQNSILTQTGTTAISVGGKLNLPALGTATAGAGFKSRPLDFVTSVFNSSSATAVPQTFQWQAEPVGNNTTSPAGAFSLLYGSGTAAPSETGLKIAKNGIITFASGQTFPGATGTGTVTSVGLSAPTSDFKVTGSPVTTSGTLKIAWNVAPTSAATANAIVKRDASGSFSAGAVNATLGVSSTVAAGDALFGESNGSASGSNGVEGRTTAGPGSGVVGLNISATGGIGVYGSGGSGSASTGIYGTGTVGVFGTGSSYGFKTDSNVQQARTAGGWVKAMAYVQGFNAPYTITLCFNSTLAGAAATTPPCGFNLTEISPGAFDVDFGFQVSDRFFQATADIGEGYPLYAHPVSGSVVLLYSPDSSANYHPFAGYIFVF